MSFFFSLFFFFFLRDQVPKMSFFLLIKSHSRSFFLLRDNVSNNVLFSFSPLSVVFPLDRAIDGVWVLCTCWNQVKLLIFSLKETIPLKYKFMLLKPTVLGFFLSFFSLLFSLSWRKLFPSVSFFLFSSFSACAKFEFLFGILKIIQNPSGGLKFFSFLFFSFWLLSFLWIPF